jgi:hypothetical protein
MHWLRNIAVVLMIGTLGVFLFPVAAGPFTTTNGPVTAFRAAAAGLALLLAITKDGLLFSAAGNRLCWAGRQQFVLRQKHFSCSYPLSAVKAFFLTDSSRRVVSLKRTSCCSIRQVRMKPISGITKRSVALAGSNQGRRGAGFIAGTFVQACAGTGSEPDTAI